MPADSMPDFDSMTPEQIMAFMETLAKRQGATEGFTTAADMDIAEIDPSTVVVDEPGYVPYGEDTRKPAASAPAAPPARPPQPAPVPVAPPAPPVAAAPPPQPVRPSTPILEPVEDAAIFESETEVAPAVQNSMAWLESLAADQGSGGFPGFDLSSLSAEPAPTQAVESPVDPMAWLESLAQSQEAPSIDFSALTPAAPTQPVSSGGVSDPLAAGVDPVAWLESLARREGATEGFTREGNIDIPRIDPSSVVLDEPGYTEYSPFAKPQAPSEAPRQPAPEPPRAAQVEPLQLEDPGAWLDALASNEGFGKETVPAVQPPPPAFDPSNPFPGMSRAEIDAAAAQGKLNREQMQAWLDMQADSFGEQILRSEQLEQEMADYDPNAPAVPAELPDWLLDQLGQPGTNAPVNVVAAPAEKPPLIDEILPPPPSPEMPDWLQPQFDQATADLDSIFQQTAEPAEPTLPVVIEESVQEVPQVVAVPEMEIDTSDPWVQALDEEDSLSTNEMPDWYLRNLNDPARIAAVDRLISGEEELPQSNLPEEDSLIAGEVDAVPVWANEAPTVQPVAAVVIEEEPAAIQSEMPDWLRDAGPALEPAPVLPDNWLAAASTEVDATSWLTESNIDESQIPEWLRETMQTGETTAIAPQPQPLVQPVQEAPRQPAYIAPAALNINVEETLATARAQAAANVTVSLQAYESLIRGSHRLDEVVADLNRLVSANRTNPAVYRVLGDGLMRQGKLQDALDTYRNALNQL